MKKVMGGNVYDTNTAKPIGTRDYNYGSKHGFMETLYYTKSGRYFVHGKGGPSSPYADEKTNNERITPCTQKQAKEWAEDNLTPVEYVKWFDVSDEDSAKVPLNTTISVSTLAKLREIKAETKKSFGAIIDEMIGGLK